jgi:hypothetical protein
MTGKYVKKLPTTDSVNVKIVFRLVPMFVIINLSPVNFLESVLW